MTALHNNMQLADQVFNVSATGFEDLALNVFRFQYEQNEVYQQYCNAINIQPSAITSIDKIPFLPIGFFKTKEITTTTFDAAIIFESSGTTGTVNGKHFVKDVLLYKQSFLKTFSTFLGAVNKYCIVGLLPSYLEREHSSLVWMVNELIKRSGNAKSGFYLYDVEKLKDVLIANEQAKQPTLLIGVTYALLDFAEKFPISLQHTIVMETGGMKGRREELTRTEVHDILFKQFNLTQIYSEYGMTELLSQAYSVKDGIFNCPPWMKIVLRAEDDPFEIIMPANIDGTYASGAVNIIDLANLYSCSFIATDDMGKLYKDEGFEIIGRLDNSDIRGCGLMLL